MEIITGFQETKISESRKFRMMCGLSVFDFYNRFDQSLRFVAHQEERFFQMIPAVKYMRNQRMYI